MTMENHKLSETGGAAAVACSDLLGCLFNLDSSILLAIQIAMNAVKNEIIKTSILVGGLLPRKYGASIVHMKA